jgi:hypothetical protein
VAAAENRGAEAAARTDLFDNPTDIVNPDAGASAAGEPLPPGPAGMDGMPPPSATAGETHPAAHSRGERSLAPAEESRVVASIAERPRSKSVLIAIVVLLLLAALAFFARQKLAPRLPGAAFHPLSALSAPAGEFFAAAAAPAGPAVAAAARAT